MKLSRGKVTWPGAKQVHRGPGGDVLGLRDEPRPPGHQVLLVRVMRDGRRLGPPEPLAETSKRCTESLARLPPAAP
jgi:nicotinate phosphoribosyltransferase